MMMTVPHSVYCADIRLYTRCRNSSARARRSRVSADPLFSSTTARMTLCAGLCGLKQPTTALPTRALQFAPPPCSLPPSTSSTSANLQHSFLALVTSRAGTSANGSTPPPAPGRVCRHSTALLCTRRQVQLQRSPRCPSCCNFCHY